MQTNNQDSYKAVYYAASGWAFIFGIVHFLWALSFYFWPTFGRITLGPQFEWGFSQPYFITYDLIVACLFILAAIIPIAIHKSWETYVSSRLLIIGIWIAATLLFLRGISGSIIATLVILGVIRARLRVGMFYDYWFLLGGTLFLIAAIHATRKRRAKKT